MNAGFEVHLYHTDGTLVYSTTVPDHQVNTRVLRTGNLKPGIYIVRLRQEKRTLESLKFVIE